MSKKNQIDPRLDSSILRVGPMVIDLLQNHTEELQELITETGGVLVGLAAKFDLSTDPAGLDVKMTFTKKVGDSRHEDVYGPNQPPLPGIPDPQSDDSGEPPHIVVNEGGEPSEGPGDVPANGAETTQAPAPVKRGRGRPRKNPLPEVPAASPAAEPTPAEPAPEPTGEPEGNQFESEPSLEEQMAGGATRRLETRYIAQIVANKI